MRKIHAILIVFFAFLFLVVLPASGTEPGNTLSGTITDKISGKPLPGVTIYISNLKTGAISDKNGIYKIQNLPMSKVMVQVTCIGYRRILETVDLNITSIKNFEMEETVAELHEIVVTGLSQATENHRTSTPVTVVPQIQLNQVASNNIIDAISKQPGVSQFTTGTGISKPVIRGLGFNRIVVVNDGIRQEGQQWGDEHGIEMDEYAVHSVEILKGPASLLYGSDALAGVINFNSAPTLPEDAIEGRLIASYQTNNGLIGYSANIAGNNNNIHWDFRLSNKKSHAYKNAYDGYVFNSGFSESNISGTIGVNKPWGYSHLTFGRYFMLPGIIEGERDSLSGDFLKPVAINDSTSSLIPVTSGDNLKYKSYVPFQKINHYKLVLNNHFVLGASNMKVVLGYQQNRRREFGNVFDVRDYGLSFLLHTTNYDIKYMFPVKKELEISLGLSGMLQQSLNNGNEYLIPEYRLFDAGVVAFAKKNIGKLDLAGGIRVDIRYQKADELYVDSTGVKTSGNTPGSELRFVGFEREMEGISASAGATYQLSEVLYTKLNISRGFRAPNIAELGSNGVHEGSGRYEVGNRDLKPENSLQYDFTFGINSMHVTGELNVFSNTIHNFIFFEKVTDANGEDSLIDNSSVYRFEAAKANLKGGEINIDIHPHPLDWLHFENSFAYVEGTRIIKTDSTKYLPFMPAPKFSSEIRATSRKIGRCIENAYLKAGIEYYFTQSKIYSQYQTESATPGYSLVNVGAGADIKIRKRKFGSLYLNINNLLDKPYQSHLSRLKYLPENYNTGRKGVYEMGRNFSIKLILFLEAGKTTQPKS